VAYFVRDLVGMATRGVAMIFFPFFGAPCCQNLVPWMSPSRFEQFHPLRIAATPLRANLLICVGSPSHKQVPLLHNIHCDMPQASYILHLRGCERNLADYASVRNLSEFMALDVEIKDCNIDSSTMEKALADLRKAR